MSVVVHPPPLKLALACFGSALCFLALGGVGLVWIAPQLAAGLFPLPQVIAVVHLFTLGWITLSMIAALHHFVPVALHTRLLSPRLAWLQLVLFDAGLAGFTVGEAGASPGLAWAGATLVGGALLGFAVALAAAMRRVRPRGRTTWALAAAACFLALTLGLGVALAGARAYGWLAAQRLDLLSLHVRLALTGWVLLVVLAVGQRLLPMFLLTRAPAPRPSAAALLLAGVGALGSIALGRSEGWLGLLPLLASAAGLVIFLAQAVRAVQRSGRARVDPGLRLAFAGLAFLGLALLIAPFATGAAAAAAPRRLVLLVGTVVLGGLSLFIAGHYYRLVPFLVWSSRWATVPGDSAPGSPAALYRSDAASASLVLLVVGAGTMLAGAGRGAAGGARLGALGFVLGVGILGWQMVRVMASRPR